MVRGRKLLLKILNLLSFDLGPFQVEKAGYQFLELQGLQKSSVEFAQITEVLLGGEVASGAVYCVKDDFYWAGADLRFI